MIDVICVDFSRVFDFVLYDLFIRFKINKVLFYSLEVVRRGSCICFGSFISGLVFTGNF